MEQQVVLGDFIRDVLNQIVQGVRNANEDLSKALNTQDRYFYLRYGTDQKNPGIKFDVAVTTLSGQKEKAGFAVALVNLAGGASVDKTKEGQHFHRIQFEVALHFDVT